MRTAGETLGSVQDVVIDSQGKVTHAIVSKQSSSGMSGSTAGSTAGGSTAASGMSSTGGTLVAIPWQTVKSAMQGGNVVLERSRLQNAPSFSAANMPDFSSSTWSSEADRHWQQGATRTATMDDDGGETTSL
jgi:sporulation protein YlmC with PRC-barrel domain